MATTPDTDLPLTEQFLRYSRYVRNWSPRTVECYWQALRECPASITKASLNVAVVTMRERGLTPGGINLRARAINSYLTWLHEDGYLPERLKIKMLRNPPKPVQKVLGGVDAAGIRATGTGRRGRRKMTAAQKKAVSLRMKKYWAARKKKG